MNTSRWTRHLDELMERIGRHFGRSEARQNARNYLLGLLSKVSRKNTWQMAEMLGQTTPYALQQFLYRGRWSADDVRDEMRDYVVENLGEEDARMVLDETGFLKKGEMSVGVQRQYTGTAGRIENSQVGVFLTYASPKGTTFLDRELYLPESWTDDRERMDKAGVPEEVEFATKPQLAVTMMKRALEAGVPARWVTTDHIYGEYGALRDLLEEHGRSYVLAVSGKAWLPVDGGHQRVSAVLARLPAEGGWRRFSIADGAKGQRIYDWRMEPLPQPAPAGWSRWLLVRRSVSHPTDMTAYVCYCREGTALATLAKVAGDRWTVEQCFEEAKGEVGLDEYEVRSWQGWYRHITMSCLAHAYLAVLRATEPDAAAELKKGDRETASPGSLSAFKASRGLSSG